MVYIALILLIITCILIGILLEYLCNYFFNKNYDIKMKIVVDKKNNIYFLKQYFEKNKLIKIQRIAKISNDQSEIQIY